jgi:arylsulfatase A-like enzyme
VRQIEAQDPKTPLFLYVAPTAPQRAPAPQSYLDAQRTSPILLAPTRHDHRDDQVALPRSRRARSKRHADRLRATTAGRVMKVTGEVDMSKGSIPSDNAVVTEVDALRGRHRADRAREPARARRAGGETTGAIRARFDTTLAGLAGASLSKAKPLDGLDVWGTIAEGKPSPRTEVVYNIGPFVAGLRQGDWKLVWRTTLPSQTELFNLADDPYEKTNLAEQQPAKVAELRARVEALARESVMPLLMQESVGWLKRAAFSEVATPEDAAEVEREP